MKKWIKSWMRRHHYNTNPAKISHRIFINALGKLEEFADVEDLANKGQTTDESWKEILEAINSISDEKASDLEVYIRNKKDQY